MLFGRDDERARIGLLLESARSSRSGALVLHGEPGVGKTALLEDTREQAADMHVLAARGVESESELPFAALHQLLRPAFGLLDRLPPPQSAAFRGALGLDDGAAAQRFLVFAACLSLLAELAGERPVLCLIDDAHWLDAASSDALRFVARRLDAEGVAMVFAARADEARGFEAADLPSLTVSGLDADASAALLAQGAGVETAPSVRHRLVAQTRGNALALLEVPSALTAAQLVGDEPLPDALPMTKQVEEVFLDRVRRLPEDTQRLLVVAAADDSENVMLVARAGSSLGIDAGALDAAEVAGLVSVAGARFTFRHPLVRSAVYEAATSSTRRDAHRALAGAMEGDGEHADRRTWHLAASALEPDDAIVRSLEAVAARAEHRGGYMASSRALERAAELSSDGAAKGRRLVAAARAASVAGGDDHAVPLARQAHALATEPLPRAEIAWVLAVAETRHGRPADAIPVAIEAAETAAEHDLRKALELLILAFGAATDTTDLEAQLRIGAYAATLEPDDDDWSAFVIRFLAGCAAMAAGDAERAAPQLEEALAWAASSDDERVVYWASTGALWVGEDRRAGDLAGRATALARTHGAIGVLAGALGVRATQHFAAQQFDEAVLAGEEAVRFAHELGAANVALLPRAALAGVAAVRGDEAATRAHANAVLDVARPHGLVLRTAGALRGLALLELGHGRWIEALEHLDALAEMQGALPAMMTTPDRVEAAVRSGRRDTAEAALSAFEAWAPHWGTWALPRLACCRALLADGDAAAEHYDEALAMGERARPFDLARIQLLYGEHLRRARRRTDSRAQLRAALEGFDRLGARPWADRARTELRASGESARKRDPSTMDDLTPQEVQVARLVAEGLSNKEVAAQLYLSPRTIDYHLRNVYSKLGVTSRTHLVRLFPREQDQADLRAELSTA
jgi:DNA-binding CsgD family transcriptional regulator